ncbi:hypothetical protein [Streptomyces longispororuber]|uniref:hypothetical protein n=1 Tax=Streptomyces longispororuber TaxID=68230 RepID=UPI0021093F30|nr:hypothetical protein [Streptomyces longispororuber]MCQ4214529.1 hypothetical protein [Streptomyces longispororuber]
MTSTPQPPPEQPVVSAGITQLPRANAVAAVAVALAAVLGAIAVVVVAPSGLDHEVLGAATTIIVSGFALATRLAVPRR